MKPFVLLAAATFVSLRVLAAPSLESDVMDGAGARSSGGRFSLVSAVAQPGGVQRQTSGGKQLCAGFLGAFGLRPGKDVDSDGLADEFDNDNDADGLDDVDEITGEPFNGLAATDPNVADTDGDGASDGAEAVAGSNPMDDSVYLHFTGLSYDGDTQSCSVTWQAHGGRSYLVYSVDDLKDSAHRTLLGTVTVNTGIGPWKLTSTNFVDTTADAASSRTYYLAVEPSE